MWRAASAPTGAWSHWEAAWWAGSTGHLPRVAVPAAGAASGGAGEAGGSNAATGAPAQAEVPSGDDPERRLGALIARAGLQVQETIPRGWRGELYVAQGGARQGLFGAWAETNSIFAGSFVSRTPAVGEQPLAGATADQPPAIRTHVARQLSGHPASGAQFGRRCSDGGVSLKFGGALRQQHQPLPGSSGAVAAGPAGLPRTAPGRARRGRVRPSALRQQCCPGTDSQRCAHPGRRRRRRRRPDASGAGRARLRIAGGAGGPAALRAPRAGPGSHRRGRAGRDRQRTSLRPGAVASEHPQLHDRGVHLAERHSRRRPVGPRAGGTRPPRALPGW